MLRSTPMKHVRLLVLTEDLPQASLALADMESFHPDTRPPTESRLDGLPGREYRETFAQASLRLEKIAKLIPVEEPPAIEQVRVVDFAELRTLNDWLGKVWNETSSYEEDLRRLDDEERLVKEQQAALANFAHLNIDLSMLRSKTRFLDFYVGLVPRENLRQLEGAVGLADHILHVYMHQGENAHVVIIGPTGTKEAQLSAVLDAAGFQNLPIPRELDRTPAELQRDLDAQRQAIDAQRKTLSETLERWSEPFRKPLLEARHTLMLAEPLVSLDPSIRSAGSLAYLAGWVPARSVQRLESRLRESLNHPFEMTARNPAATNEYWCRPYRPRAGSCHPSLCWSSSTGYPSTARSIQPHSLRSPSS
jgi:V/A-type H+/Na+-transporting ATPase subunit I